MGMNLSGETTPSLGSVMRQSASTPNCEIRGAQQRNFRLVFDAVMFVVEAGIEIGRTEGRGSRRRLPGGGYATALIGAFLNRFCHPKITQ